MIEEVARIYGFENIERVTESVVDAYFTHWLVRIVFKDKINHLCCRYHEAINYSFVNKDMDNQISGQESKLELLNPISIEMAAMKSSHLAGLFKPLRGISQDKIIGSDYFNRKCI